MTSLEIFVVFHKTLFDECYDELTPEEFKYLTFIAVNENIQKYYNNKKYTKVIHEYQLEKYDGFYQANRYNENSVLKHIHDNNLAKTDYIGIVQYDMKFPKNSINQIIQQLSPNRCLSVMKSPFVFSFIDSCAIRELPYISSIPQHFCAFSGRIVDNRRDYPLLNSFIVHKDVFAKSLAFFLHMINVIRPNAEIGCIGGVFERVNAYAFSHNSEEIVASPIIDMNNKLKALAY
jgi:hypothetical protein